MTNIVELLKENPWIMKINKLFIKPKYTKGRIRC